MKLIEAIILAQQEYGIYGDWKAIHADGCYIGLHYIELNLNRPVKYRKIVDKRGKVTIEADPDDANNLFPHYSAYGTLGDLISQSDRLETVLSDFAERYPYQTLDERWKVSRWEG